MLIFRLCSQIITEKTKEKDLTLPRRQKKKKKGPLVVAALSVSANERLRREDQLINQVIKLIIIH